MICKLTVHQVTCQLHGSSAKNSCNRSTRLSSDHVRLELGTFTFIALQGQSAREKPYRLIKHTHAHYLESMANCVDASNWVPVKK